MGSWMDIVTGTIDAAASIAMRIKFLELVQKNREEGMAFMQNMVQTNSVEMLDKIEVEFLNFSLTLFDLGQRRRAMELYAWLKIVELGHYNQFRGFPNG